MDCCSYVAANIMDIFMVTTCAGTIYFANKDALKAAENNNQWPQNCYLFSPANMIPVLRTKVIEDK